MVIRSAKMWGGGRGAPLLSPPTPHDSCSGCARYLLAEFQLGLDSRLGKATTTCLQCEELVRSMSRRMKKNVGSLDNLNRSPRWR